MVGDDVREQAAARLRRVWQGGDYCPPPRDLIGCNDLDAAYAVQALNTAWWQSRGRRPIGRKIGATSQAIQDLMGVDYPSTGVLFEDMQVTSGQGIAMSDLQQPFVEAEVAFILARNLGPDDTRLDDLADAVAHAAAAIEVIGSRIRDWDIGISDSICDNTSSSMFVLAGALKPLDDFDPYGCAMTMHKAGEQVSSGDASVCLGGPLYALQWLALEAAKRGQPLRAGEIILTGAMGPIVKVAAGDVIDVSIEGLGAVQARFDIE